MWVIEVSIAAPGPTEDSSTATLNQNRWPSSSDGCVSTLRRQRR
jgi:hypothetical protein